MNLWKMLALCLACSLIGGCCSVAPFKGISIESDSLYISGLALVRQDKHDTCGPACVASVAAFWDVPLATFRKRRAPMPADTTAAQLEVLVHQLGLQSFAYRGSMADLEENIRSGRPIIVMIPQPVVPTGGLAGASLLEAWNRWGPKPAHWVTVVGMQKHSKLFLNDPESGPIEMEWTAFEKGWSQKDWLALLIVAPSPT